MIMVTTGAIATDRDITSQTNIGGNGEKRAKGKALPGKDVISRTKVGTDGKKRERAIASD